MRLIDTIEFKVPGTNGDDGWSFDVTVPPIEVADEICDILDPIEVERRAAGVALFSDPSVRDRLGEKLSKADIIGDPALMQALMATPVLDIQETPREIKTKLAALVRPLCGPPLGLTLDDDRGGALTWDEVAARDPVFCREVLYQAAEAIYSRIQGQAQELVLKNSGSSSPS
jgi:hypothetical protein